MILLIPKTTLGKLRMALLVILGAIPATFMGYYGVLLSLNGFMTFLTEGGWLNLLTGAWGVAGVLGAIAIWRVSLGYESLIAYAGLIAGVIAAFALPVGLGTYRYLTWNELLFSATMLPVYCALYLVVDVVVRIRNLSARQKHQEHRKRKAE